MRSYEIPAPQTMRDFLERFGGEEEMPLWQGEKAVVPMETSKLRGLDKVRKVGVEFVQKNRPMRLATLDIDATILESWKEAAKVTYEGTKGYQLRSFMQMRHGCG